LRARIDRLEVLFLGLGKEMSLWEDYNAVLPPVETVAYREALGKARSALNEARAILAKTCWQLEDKKRQAPPQPPG
jgi:hypothetical protein